jgi:hypothetical protein
MVLDQRNAGASVNNAAGNIYTLDRWQANADQASKFSIQQNAGSVTPPVGFTNYLGCTSLSAYSVPSNEAYLIRQKIEGYNFADLGWGTANAKTVTVSFWVRSSLTGTFSGVLLNSASNRCFIFTYTISAANTWEYKTITIPGDITGTWLTTNGVGLEIRFSLGAGASLSGTAGSWLADGLYSATGAVSVVGTSGATFYITGVQLEVGSSATSFEYRPYGTELALCQRYAILYGREQPYNQIGTTGFAYGTSNGDMPVPFPVQMRVIPTITVSGSFQISDAASATAITNIAVITTQSSTNIGSIRFTTSGGATVYRPYRIETANSSTAFVLFSSEL